MKKDSISTIENKESRTMNGKWENKSRQILAAFVANLSSIAYATATSWATPSLPLLKDSDSSPLESGRAITEEEESWLGSLVFMGALVASPIFSYVSQKYGRKVAGYLSTIPFIISWLILIFSNSIYLFYASRFIMGVSSGGVLVFCPMYIGELAEDNIRGTLGTIRSTIGNLTFLFMCCVAPMMSIGNMAIVCLMMPILFACAFWWLPESPLYLMKTGRNEEAMESLLWLREGNLQAAKEEMMKLTVIVKESREVSIKDLISSRGTRRALGICIFLGITQQFSGIYPILSYCVSIFELAGSTISPNTASIIVACVQILGSLLSSVFMDTAGRRFLLISSQTAMAICLAAVGTYFYLQQLGFDMTVVGLLPVICLGIFVFSLSFGSGSVNYIIMAEMFSPEARGLATSFTTMTVWISAFLATKFYPNLVNLLQIYGCYWVFSSVCIACIVFTIFKIPETKNRSLESILRELNGDFHKEDDETDIKRTANSSVQDKY